MIKIWKHFYRKLGINGIVFLTMVCYIGVCFHIETLTFTFEFSLRTIMGILIVMLFVDPLFIYYVMFPPIKKGRNG